MEMGSDDAAPAKLSTAGPNRPRNLDDLSRSPHPLTLRDMSKDYDAAPSKLPTAGPKRPRLLEDVSSSPHPPPPERLIYIDVVKHDDPRRGHRKRLSELETPLPSPASPLGLAGHERGRCPSREALQDFNRSPAGAPERGYELRRRPSWQEKQQFFNHVHKRTEPP